MKEKPKIEEIVLQLATQVLRLADLQDRQAKIVDELAKMYANQAVELKQVEKRFEGLKNYVAETEKYQSEKVE